MLQSYNAEINVFHWLMIFFGRTLTPVSQAAFLDVFLSSYKLFLTFANLPVFPIFIVFAIFAILIGPL